MIDDCGRARRCFAACAFVIERARSVRADIDPDADTLVDPTSSCGVVGAMCASTAMPRRRSSAAGEYVKRGARGAASRCSVASARIGGGVKSGALSARAAEGRPPLPLPRLPPRRSCTCHESKKYVRGRSESNGERRIRTTCCNGS